MTLFIAPLRAGSALAATLLAGLMITGCAPQKSDAPAREQGVYFPPPPAPPRFQFLTSFSDAESLIKQKSSTGFADWVVGSSGRDDSSSSFNSPYGIAVTAQRIYLCDVASNKVHVLNLENGGYSTLAADGRIKNPVNLTIDTDGTKYLCDTESRTVLVFDAADRYVREFGNPAEWTPLDVAIRGDELYIADTTGGEIEVWSKSGQPIRKIGQKGLGPDQLTNPTNLAFGPDGRLYVVDTFLQIVKVFDPQLGSFLGTIGQPGARIGSFARPKGIAISQEGTIYVTDAQWDVVQIFNPDGQLLMLFGEPGDKPWSMGLPAGVVIDRESLPFFRKWLAPNFQAEYLLFVVNQFGRNKVAVYAFGRSTDLPASAYEVDVEAVERRRQELRDQETPPQ